MLTERPPIDLPVYMEFIDKQMDRANSFWDMNYFLRLFATSLVQYIQKTDRKWCIWAHRANCTGGLKKARSWVEYPFSKSVNESSGLGWVIVTWTAELNSFWTFWTCPLSCDIDNQAYWWVIIYDRLEGGGMTFYGNFFPRQNISRPAQHCSKFFPLLENTIDIIL